MDLSKMIEGQATAMNLAAGRAYTAAQYEERIERLRESLENILTWYASLAEPGLVPDGARLGVELRLARRSVEAERAHRTAEAAGLTGESEVERARRLA